MSYEVPGFKVGTRIADADLSAKQYYFVKIAADNKWGVCGDGELGLGVLQNKPTAGLECEVVRSGISKVVAGDAVTEGAFVASDGNGKAVPATSGEYILGVAYEAASADGDIIAVDLFIPGKAA